MATIDLYTQTGEKKGTVKVDDKMFAVENCNHTLIQEALVRQEANARQNIAHSKSRGEVRGGGAKPHPQKGTGRARQGSSRNIHMRGGAVCFGPKNVRNFSKMMPKKQRRKAMFSALTLKHKDGEVIALEKYENKEAKTKIFSEMISKLDLKRSLLIVVPEKNEQIELSCRNLPKIKVILSHNLNVKDILSYKNVMFLKEALTKAEEVFCKEKESTK